MVHYLHVFFVHTFKCILKTFELNLIIIFHLLQHFPPVLEHLFSIQILKQHLFLVNIVLISPLKKLSSIAFTNAVNTLSVKNLSIFALRGAEDSVKSEIIFKTLLRLESISPCDK